MCIHKQCGGEGRGSVKFLQNSKVVAMVLYVTILANDCCYSCYILTYSGKTVSQRYFLVHCKYVSICDGYD